MKLFSISKQTSLDTAPYTISFCLYLLRRKKF